MPGIDAASFDGTIVQTELETDCGFAPDRTQLGLVAQASDGFVVVHGSDENRDTFSDADISAIFVTFAETVAQYPGADSSTMRTAIQQALAGQWTPCNLLADCPFDEKVTAPTRLIFHVHIPGWGFEPARIKFKSELPAGQFCGLKWLTLNGASCAPYSFELGAQCETEASYDFALFIQAAQEAGNQRTRVIIDPKIEITPPRDP
ncbi:hypothetical protein [Maricaulis parjimensis]|uniref:hypothetical protein n=1 Tax=Maricaulis parjimensis TaxID=144023 RepID=UPI00193A37F4|nr:hypothetical protein [Maricaulis parjimensis]